jgi:hypothetical protein
MSTIEETRPVPIPMTAPVVVSRRQVSDSSSTGKLADAATAKASPVRICTLNVCSRPAAR